MRDSYELGTVEFCCRKTAVEYRHRKAAIDGLCRKAVIQLVASERPTPFDSASAALAPIGNAITSFQPPFRPNLTTADGHGALQANPDYFGLRGPKSFRPELTKHDFGLTQAANARPYFLLELPRDTRDDDYVVIAE